MSLLDHLQKTYEAPTCYSQSQLWTIISNHYQKLGPESWDQQVPYTVTNTVSTARYHAEAILRHADPKSSYAIIDYGAGIGQHGYLLAKQLSTLCEKHDNSLQQFTIYLAEISEDCIKHWAQSENIQHFMQIGLIKPLKLSGDWIQDITRISQLRHQQHCLIASYLLDSMPFEAYCYTQKQGLSITCARKYLTPSFYGPLSALHLHNKPLPNEPLHPLAKHYQHLPRYTIPSMAITFCQTFFSQTNDALMLINDKGYMDLSTQPLDEHFNLHLEGNFSTSVNFHALRLGLIHYNMYAINTTAGVIQTLAFSHKNIELPQSTSCSDIATIIQHFKHCQNLNASLCISLCKVLEYDPFCLEILSQSIEPDATPTKLIGDCIEQCLNNLLNNRHNYSLLHIAKIYRRIGQLDTAVEYLNLYKTRHTADSAYHFETALLLLAQNQQETAKAHLAFCLTDPKTRASAKQLLDSLPSE